MLRARVRDEERLIREAIEDELESLDGLVRDFARSLLADQRFLEFAERRAMHRE